jgi:PIN domain nuclease of toxin-antitoxin system
MALQPQRLGEASRSMIADRANSLFLSIASTWEIVVKQARGKLELPLDVSLDHVFALDSIPDRHRDPFDRMLVAQALVEGMKLVSADPRILAYPIATIDARQ